MGLRTPILCVWVEFIHIFQFKVFAFCFYQPFLISKKSYISQTYIQMYLLFKNNWLKSVRFQLNCGWSTDSKLNVKCVPSNSVEIDDFQKRGQEQFTESCETSSIIRSYFNFEMLKQIEQTRSIEAFKLKWYTLTY